MKQKEIVIMSLGGSLIVPNEVDFVFLKAFRKFIVEQLNNKRFILICGGGKTCRKYQDAAKLVTDIKENDLDLIGISATKMNAQLLQALFNKNVHKTIIDNPTVNIHFKEDILIASGWKPGFSSDCDAVLLAKNLGVKRIINLSNIDYVHTKDPKKHTDATPIKDITWTKFKQLLPKKWSPGLNSPFDPIASRRASKLGIEVMIVNGRNLKNLKKCIEKKQFVGTRIHS